MEVTATEARNRLGYALSHCGRDLAAPDMARWLKKPVASLSHRAGEVTAAMDAAISGF